MATAPTRLLTSCRSCRSGAGRGGAVLPGTPHPGTGWRQSGGLTSSLPAGPLPGQLVTFPGRPRTVSLVASSGLGLAEALVEAAARGRSDSAASSQPAFPPGSTQPGALCSPLTPTHFQAPLSSFPT